MAATPGGWTFEVATGVGDGCENVALAHLAEDLYVACSRTGNSLTMVLKRNGTTHAWSTVTADATSLAYNFKPQSIVVCDATHLAVSGTSFRSSTRYAEIYYTTNGGAAWTNSYSHSFGNNPDNNYPKLSPRNGLNIARLDMNTGMKYAASTDCGATWGTAIIVDDNRGSPSVTGDQEIPSSGASSLGPGFLNAIGTPEVLFESGSGGFTPHCCYSVSSQDGGSFWTIPYRSEGSGAGTQNVGISCPTYPSGGGGVVGNSGEGTQNAHVWECGASGGSLSIMGSAGVLDACPDFPSGTAHTHCHDSGQYVPLTATNVGNTCSSGNLQYGKTSAVFTNTRNEAILASVCTGTGAFRIHYLSAPNAAWALSYTNTGVVTVQNSNAALAAIMTPGYSYVAFGNSSIGGRLELIYAATPPAIADPSISAGATTAAFPSGYTLKGFDVDYMQQAVVARLEHAGDGVNTVYSFDPISLAIRGASPVANSCTLSKDGVMATWQSPPGISYTAYTDCMDDPQEVNFLRIRGGDLNTPSHVGTLCDPNLNAGGSDFCSIDLTGDDTGSEDCPNDGVLDTNARTIAQVLAVPISWRRSHDDPRVRDSVHLGFAYATVAPTAGSGRVGVFAYSAHGGAGDTSCFDEVPYGGAGTNAADQICSWRGLDGNDYLTAVSVVNPTTTWRVAVEEKLHNFPTSVEYIFTAIPSLIQVSQMPPMYGVGCNQFSNSTVLMDGSGHINRYTTVGTNLYQRLWDADISDAATGTLRGVTQSWNGAWGAYVRNDGKWAVINADTGEVVGFGPMPTGTFRGIAVSGNGLSVFIATDTKIERFNTAAVTVGVSESGVPNASDNQLCIASNCTAYNTDLTEDSGTGSTPGVATARPGLPGVDTEVFSAALGITTEAGGWVIGLFLIVALAGGLYTVRPALSVLGAVLGMGMSFAFDLLPLWPILLLALIGAAIVVLNVSRRGSSA